MSRRYSSSRIILTLDTPRLEHLSLINTTQQIHIKHTIQLHTFKIVSSEHHDLHLKALTYLTELKLVCPSPLPQLNVNFTRLNKLSISLAAIDTWASCTPNLKELSLYYTNSLQPSIDLSAQFPRLDTLDVHNEDTLQLIPKMVVTTFKCTKFDFQYVRVTLWCNTNGLISRQQDTITSKFPSSMEHFWIRACNILTLPLTMTDKDGYLLLPPTLKSLHIFKTSTSCNVAIKQVPCISLIANSGSEIFVSVTNVQQLELVDNSNKITLHGNFSALQHLILRRNTLIKINDQGTLNRRALLTFDVDIV